MKPSNNPGPRAKALPNFEPNRPWGASKKIKSKPFRGVNWRYGSGINQKKR